MKLKFMVALSKGKKDVPLLREVLSKGGFVVLYNVNWFLFITVVGLMYHMTRHIDNCSVFQF